MIAYEVRSGGSVMLETGALRLEMLVTLFAGEAGG